MVKPEKSNLEDSNGSITEGQGHFHKIVDELPQGKKSKIFGADCIQTTQGKTTAILWQNSMMFKLPPADIESVLKLKGTKPGTHLYASQSP